MTGLSGRSDAIEVALRAHPGINKRINAFTTSMTQACFILHSLVDGVIICRWRASQDNTATRATSSGSDPRRASGPNPMPAPGTAPAPLGLPPESSAAAFGITQRYRCVSAEGRVPSGSASGHARSEGERHARTQADGSCRGRHRRAPVSTDYTSRCRRPFAICPMGIGARHRCRDEACHPAPGRGFVSGLDGATRSVPTDPRLLRGSPRLLCAAQLLFTSPGELRVPRVLPCAAVLLPARARVCSPGAAFLRADTWLLCAARVVLWLLWCPGLPSIGRFRLSAPVRISAARRLASQVMAEDRRTQPPWSCAIGSWKSRPSCS